MSETATLTLPRMPACDQAAREMGVLLGKGGLHGNVLRIKPPLCVTREDADFAVEVLDVALARAAGHG